MIIASRFVGDDDISLKNAQHDVYGSALHIMIDQCNQFAEFAKTLLDDTGHGDWGGIPRQGCDHRTLQTAHDLLAAAWRYQTDARQPRLPFPPTLPCAWPSNDVPIATLWLGWLRNELSGWIDHPHLVRSIHVILNNQNNSVGYAAETRLCRDIMDRFGRIPWTWELRKDIYRTSWD